MSSSPSPSSSEEENINPLYLPLILKNILDHLPVTQLAHVRLVCSQWAQIASPLLQEKINKIKLTFSICPQKMKRAMESESPPPVATNSGDDEDGDVESDLDDDSVSSSSWESYSSGDDLAHFHKGKAQHSKITEYLNHLQLDPIFKDIPPLSFSNFCFDSIKLRDSLVESFFNACGPTIRTLQISLDTQELNTFGDQFGFDSDEEDENEPLQEDHNDAGGRLYLDRATFRKILFHHCPNIESLELSGLPQNVTVTGFLFQDEVKNPPFTKIKRLKIHHYYRTPRISNDFLRDMFIICPQLEESVSIANYDSFKHDYQLFMGMENADRLGKLTKLSLYQVDQRIIRALDVFKDRLRLNCFRSKSFLPASVEAEFLGFLDSQSATLKSLIIDEISTYDLCIGGVPCPIMFPKCMPKLIQLRIGVGRASSPHIEFSPVDLFSQFPSLKTLLLIGKYGNINLDMFLRSENPVKALQVLELPSCLKPEIMSRIGPMFPNLIQLSIGFQPYSGFRQIWTNWPKLEFLFLCAYPPSAYGEQHNAQNIGMDELFTGYDQGQIKLLKAGNCNDEVGPPVFPSIANLIKLRELTVHSGPTRNRILNLSDFKGFGEFGNISFSHAFSTLSSLEYLHLTVRHNADFDLIDKICRDLGLSHNHNGFDGTRCDRLISSLNLYSLRLESEHFGKRPHWGLLDNLTIT